MKEKQSQVEKRNVVEEDTKVEDYNETNYEIPVLRLLTVIGIITCLEGLYYT